MMRPGSPAAHTHRRRLAVLTGRALLPDPGTTRASWQTRPPLSKREPRHDRKIAPAAQRGLPYLMEITVRQAIPSDTAVIADFNLRLAEETEQLRLEPATVRTGV